MKNHIGRIEMVANTGTYLDAPFHRYESGDDIAQLSLESVANLEGVVIHSPPDQRAIEADSFVHHDLTGKAVLIHTEWSRYWGTDQYFEGYPFLTADAAEFLVRAKVRLVGIDSLNIDDNTGSDRPVHSILLKANIPIVEHLCHLDLLSDKSFKFFAVPVKIEKMGSFPVRAFALFDS